MKVFVFIEKVDSFNSFSLELFSVDDSLNSLVIDAKLFVCESRKHSLNNHTNTKQNTLDTDLNENYRLHAAFLFCLKMITKACNLLFIRKLTIKLF